MGLPATAAVIAYLAMRRALKPSTAQVTPTTVPALSLVPLERCPTCGTRCEWWQYVSGFTHIPPTTWRLGHAGLWRILWPRR